MVIFLKLLDEVLIGADNAVYLGVPCICDNEKLHVIILLQTSFIYSSIRLGVFDMGLQYMHIILNRSFLTAVFGVLAMLFVLIAPMQGVAQAQSNSCDATKVLIFEMLEPDRASYNLWDTIYGEPTYQENFISAVTLEGRMLMAAGERRAYKEGVPVLILVKIDHRGRVVWEKEHKIEGLFSVQKIVKSPDGFIVAGTKRTTDRFRRHKLWIGVFDEDGVLIKENSFGVDKTNIEAQDIVHVPGEKAYLIAASAKKSQENAYSMIYKISDQAKVLSDSSFRPGPENKIQSITVLEGGALMGAGYVHGSDGRKHGWILSLDAKGRMDWERQYPRGQESRFSKIIDYDGKSLIVIGSARPSASLGRYEGGLVMKINPFDGDVEWERYYTGPRHYRAMDLLLSKDGLLSVALNGISAPKINKIGRKGDKKTELSEKEQEERDEALRWGLDAISVEDDFVRLLTINPRGVLLSSEEYFNSEGGRIVQLLADNLRARIIIGSTDMKDVVQTGDPDFPTETKHSLDGWIISAPGQEIYNDPCKNTQIYNP